MVQNAVAAAGVPAPAPAVVERRSPMWAPLPRHARVSGDIPGPAPVFDPYVMGGRPRPCSGSMSEGLMEVLAAIHAVPWGGGGAGRRAPRALGCARRWRAGRPTSVVVAGGSAFPRWRAALEWCVGHLPTRTGAVLLWGDVRLGNLVFDSERRVVGRARLGPGLPSGRREMDLGWHFGLESMMDVALRPVGCPGSPGPGRSPWLATSGRSGYTVGAELVWHEIFALVRALAINDRHQRIAGDPRRAETRWAPSCSSALRRSSGGRGAVISAIGPALLVVAIIPAIGPALVQWVRSRSEKPITPAFATS